MNKDSILILILQFYNHLRLQNTVKILKYQNQAIARILNYIIMQSAVNTKRQAFRNSIRHQQLEALFADKRKLLLDSDNMQVEQHTFQSIFQLLIEQKNVEENMNILAELSFSKQIAQQFEDNQKISQFYLELINFLLNSLQEYQQSNPIHTRKRICFILIISNLLVDKQCPTSSLCSIICQFIKQFYKSVAYWKFDNEIQEVGILLAKMVNNDRFAQLVQDQQIHFIFQWFEELLQIKQSKQMKEEIFGALYRIIISLRKKYKIPQNELPQIFKSQIINFIYLVLQKHKLTQFLNSKVCSFIGELLPFILTKCSFQWTKQLVNNLFHAMSTLKTSLIKSLSQLIIHIITLRGIQFDQNSIETLLQLRQKIIMHISDKYCSWLLVSLNMMQFQRKKMIFEIILETIKSDRANSKYHLEKFVNLGIENVMIRIFSAKIDNQFRIELFELVTFAQELGMECAFSQFIAYAEQIEKQFNNNSKFS